MKSRFIITVVLVLVAAFFMSCATSGDLKKLQGRVDEVALKADQAARDAAAANSAAQASQAESVRAGEKCTASAAAAEQAASRAEAAARLAEENAKKAEAIFMKSMKK